MLAHFSPTIRVADMFVLPETISYQLSAPRFRDSLRTRNCGPPRHQGEILLYIGSRPRISPNVLNSRDGGMPPISNSKRVGHASHSPSVRFEMQDSASDGLGLTCSPQVAPEALNPSDVVEGQAVMCGVRI